MAVRPGSKVQPGVMTIQAAEIINQLMRRVAELEFRLTRPANEPPVYEKFIAKITGVTTGKYAWTEQFFTSTGAYEDLVNGRTGTATDKQAYERNGAVVGSFPFYAELTRRVVVDGTPVYEFDAAVAIYPNNLTVKESDGSPSYSGITSLELDQADGFNLSQPGAGRAKVNILSATGTQRGEISLAAQVMGDGIKEFLDITYHDAGWEVFLTAGSGFYCKGEQVLLPSTNEDANAFQFDCMQFESDVYAYYFQGAQDDVGDVDFANTELLSHIVGEHFSTDGFSVSPAGSKTFNDRLLGASGTFTTVDLKTVTVRKGIIVSIV